MSSIDLKPEEVSKGMEIFFFEKPKDSVPTLRTKAKMIAEERPGKWSLLAEGLSDWYPIYHFRKATPEAVKYSSTIPLQECDDLYKRLGI